MIPGRDNYPGSNRFATSVFIFTLVIGSVVTLGTGSVDIINRSLFTLKLIALVIILVLLMPKVSLDYLLELPVH